MPDSFVSFYKSFKIDFFLNIHRNINKAKGLFNFYVVRIKLDSLVG